MPYKQLEDLPAEVTGKLPKHGQQLFMAAYNAASEDTTDDEDAVQIAWSSVKNSYKQDADGKWVSIENSDADRSNVINTDTKDPIGNRENNAGTMRGG